MAADKFLTWDTILIVVLNLLAFLFGTASGVITAKIMNLFMKVKNQSADRFGRHRVGSHRCPRLPIVANQENPHNHLIFHAMGPNLAGCSGTAISGGIMLALLGVQWGCVILRVVQC